MNNCMRLKEVRTKMGISQRALGKKLGLSSWTICKLETDETKWRAMTPSTTDKINSLFDGTFEYDSEKEEINVIEEENVISEPIVIHTQQLKDNSLNDLDNKTLTLIEFAYEGLMDSKTGKEFIANINMLKRIIKKYGF